MGHPGTRHRNHPAYLFKSGGAADARYTRRCRTAQSFACPLRPLPDFARPLREGGAWGLLYNSVRLSGHECVAAFRPPALSLPVQGQHFRYVG